MPWGSFAIYLITFPQDENTQPFPGNLSLGEVTLRIIAW